MPDLLLMGAPPIRGAIGAYGKMPAQGDFFRVDPPRGFVAAWDGWLQRAFPGARSGLGARWQECYYNAPIWRFSIARGIAGQQAVSGVLMPSVDRVGRAFPLTLVAPVAPESVGAAAHLAQADFFAALEEIALDALEDSMNLPRLVSALKTLLQRCRTASLPCGPDDRAAVSVSRGSGRLCQWSALVGGGLLHLATDALPDPRLLALMFDPGNGFWAVEAAE